MTTDDERFLSRALDLASDSVKSAGGPFGAVIVQSGAILAEGQNRVTLERDPSSHAEIVAIRRACQAKGDHRLEGCVLYASAEPCPMCLSAAYWARLHRIVFAATRLDAAAAQFDDEFLYREICRPLSARQIPTQQVTHPRANEPFLVWEQFADKVRY